MNTPTTSPEKLVAMARKRIDQTQEELAARLTEITGEAWTQGNISAIENRRRKLKVEELPWFAEAQEVRTTWYLGESLNDVLPPPTASVGDSGAYVDRGSAAFTSVTDIGQARRQRSSRQPVPATTQLSEEAA